MSETDNGGAAAAESFGILRYGCYLPRMRLARAAVGDAHRWKGPQPAGLARGEKTVCNWDEDALTMAVEAGRDCLGAADRGRTGRLLLASTTLPFAERQNATLAAEALNLDRRLETADVTGSGRAGTSALLMALDPPAAGARDRDRLVIASERPAAVPGTPAEMIAGDAAAAVLVGRGEPLARLVAGGAENVDFIDRYRSREAQYGYDWEERWIRDEGYLGIVPRAVGEVLERAALAPGDIRHMVLAAPLRGVAAKVAAALGLPAECGLADTGRDVGHAGAAAPLLGLCRVLDEAGPGEHVLLVGFGQGCDVLVLRTTGAVAAEPRRAAFDAQRARGRREENYGKYLAFTGGIVQDFGKRAEIDNQTYLSAYYRQRELLNGFMAGRCGECATVQFPRSRYCVRPDCRALDSQTLVPMADVPASVRTWTADYLGFSPSPPARYGMIEFEGGGRLMVDFTDVGAGELEVGTAVAMTFRIRQLDPRRGFRRYFWKAAPAAGPESGS